LNNETKPLIVQSDGMIYLEIDKDPDHSCRDKLLRFAELIKSPEHIHTYRVTPLAIWNAAAASVGLDEIIRTLSEYGRYEIPLNVATNIRDWYNRYGKIKLVRSPDLGSGGEGAINSIPEIVYLYSDDPVVIKEIASRKLLESYLGNIVSDHAISVQSFHRGRLKQALIKIGYPVQDLVGYLSGDKISIDLRKTSSSGKIFTVRNYQEEAIRSFQSSRANSGSGIVVLPSGAGKTIVGIGVMNRINENTLIITTGTVAARQWIRELLDKTTLSPGMIGEYTGDSKEILPVTVTTYQVMTYSPKRKTNKNEPEEIEEHFTEKQLSESDYPHLELFRARNWGLIIYDEVHLLPAPVFRITSEIQAKKRLGLTATLVREDGKEEDVFSLIGPKKYDQAWKELEREGWIATAQCYEIRVSFKNEDSRMAYAIAPQRLRYRVAAENPVKIDVVESLIKRGSPEDSVLVIGDYIDQLESVSEHLGVPLITGRMKNVERESLYNSFRTGNINVLVVSKVANYAIDLPDANVAIQISGTFGSRQEEAQRLGRLLRPKSTGSSAKFYTVVTKNTVDQDYAMRRQLFLTERGYKYTIMDQEELIGNAFLQNKNREDFA